MPERTFALVVFQVPAGNVTYGERGLAQISFCVSEPKSVFCKAEGLDGFVRFLV